MSELSTRLLLQLEDYSQCNDDLAVTIRKTVLEPFQLDLSRPEAIKKPPPTPSRFKQMATQLAPIAMKIVNQNIKGLVGLKRATFNSGNYTIAVNCLVDTSFYALTALRHMNSFTSLKPLDIEKATSNLISKMVELGEYNRVLDEIRKFRSLLASVAKVQLDTKSTVNSKKPESPISTFSKGVLTESHHNLQSPTRQSFSPVPEVIISNQSEQDMLNKYQDLFQFPFDPTINDRTMVLLILAYQMNTIRCWCELGEGALAKYIPYFMEKPGNFIDWCKHLLKIDSDTAKSQLDSFQRLLYKAANKYPLTEESAYPCYNIQTVALNTIILSGSYSLKAVMDRMVLIGMTYEKATNQTMYSQVQKCCHGLLKSLNPNVNDFSEMTSFFILCEYYAYVSRKAKSYQGAFYAYKYMIRPLIEVIESPSNCTYYHAAYAASAKLAIGSVQMDKMVLDDTFADINKTLSEAISCLRLVSTALEKVPTQDEHSQQALLNFCKSIDVFRQSSKRLYEFVSDKTKKILIAEQNNPSKTPPRMGEIATPSDFGQWNSNLAKLNAALQQCSETLPANLCLVKKNSTSTSKRAVNQTEIMTTFIDIMVLIARMNFNINDENTYQQAYEYLSTAEQMCAEVKYLAGYRWLSGCYYNLGATMIKTELFMGATYPLRKSCTLLEKDTERVNTEEGRLQICKRYEILGTCCQKNEHFEDAIKAYRLALKRVPTSAIERFVSKADTTAVTTIIENDPLVAKLIDRFLRASVIDPNQAEIHFASEFMDLSTLNQIQRCIVYECELKVWNVIALKMNVSKFQLFIVEKLLQIYDTENYPIRRSRVLLYQVRIERSKYSDREKCTRAALNYAKEVISLLKAQDYAQDSNLLNYRRHYLALASSWVAICGKELSEEVPNTFSATLQQWGILLKKITPIYNSSGSSKVDIQQVYDSIDDMDQFYDHVRMLADLFVVTGQYAYQISALRILLKLNNGLRDVNVDHVSDSIIISSTIGKVYCDMGYTGKASIEFNHARNAISHKPCNNQSELVYRVYYSNYLTCIGDHETSKEVFDATRLTWQHTPLVDSKNALTTAKAYTSRCMLLADIYSTKSLISANTDSLDNAIICSTSALQLLNKCIKVVQKSEEERKEKKKESKSFELENPFMPAPKPSKQKEAEKAVFRESQWIMAQKIGECLVTLAFLHMKKGSWNESKYFVKQGPLLGKKVNSGAISYNAYLCASDFHLRGGDLAQSQEELESALLYQPEGQNHIKDAVRLKMAMASLASANEYYDEAITAFDEANDMLQTLSSEIYISSLEQLVDIKEDTARDVKIVFDDEVDTNDKYECVPLRQIQAANIIQKALALSYKGEINSGLDILERLDESGLILQNNEIELIAAIANLRMSLLRQEISTRSDANVLLNESLALPAMKTQVPRGAMVKKSNMSYKFRLIKDNLTTSLERMVEAHRIGCNKERPSIIQGLCNESGFAMFLKNQISNSSRVLPNNYALLSSYYMEMAKGISMRREMQNCLKIKMNRSLALQAPSDTRWPLSEEEQDELAGRFAKVNLNPKWLQAHFSTLSDLYHDEHEFDDNEFQQKFVDILPNNWTVCSLTLDPVNQDLYAVQMRTNEAPFVVKIPLNRSAHRFSNSNSISYNDAFTELQEIIRASDETIRGCSKCTEPSQIQAWWDTRKDLDSRLKRLLDSIEKQWFSGFTGLLSGHTHEFKEELNKFQKGLSEVVYKLINENTANKKQIEFSVNFCRIVLRLGRYPTLRELEDLAYFTLSCYEAQEVQIDYSKFDIKKMTDQMKVLITKYHDKSSMAGVDTLKSIPNEHVILILDKYLQMFPLESTPILRLQSVSRLPCLSFLRDRILFTGSYESRVAFDDFGVSSMNEWKDFSVSRKSAFYVLNPGGDLKDTQKEFESVFSSVPEWDGVIEKTPMELQCKEALQSRDIYMYLGHSAGQAFMRGTTIRQLPTCAVSLLMGCSSGALEANGEFEPDGHILNYLLAGSPAVVGNLWDVTDKSIDKVTKHMLHTWGLLKKSGSVGKPKSLVQAVTESRSQCKLSYLIGAATVVYGIPVYLNDPV